MVRERIKKMIKKNNTAKEITYMFCRAMDSKRSVMADKDETEKKQKTTIAKKHVKIDKSII